RADAVLEIVVVIGAALRLEHHHDLVAAFRQTSGLEDGLLTRGLGTVEVHHALRQSVNEDLRLGAVRPCRGDPAHRIAVESGPDEGPEEPVCAATGVVEVAVGTT